MLRLFTDPLCQRHGPLPGYPERPERLSGVLDYLETKGLLPVGGFGGEPPHAEVLAAVEAVHDPAYVERFRGATERGDGLIDSADNPLVAGTWTAAWAAAGVAVAAADWVAGAGERQAFAAIRPPGHHAERALAMGFCYFNNIAVAAQRLIARHGMGRVAIFDFDVHHGNGTQHLFEARGDVLFASTHQFPFYPGTGAADETGSGAGAGATLNVPLPAGTGDADFRQALDHTVLPSLRRFRPEALLLSAGFDAWRGDPLGGLSLSEEAFAEMARRLRDLAAEICDGRVLAVLEGGYDLQALPHLVHRFLSELTTD